MEDTNRKNAFVGNVEAVRITAQSVPGLTLFENIVDADLQGKLLDLIESLLDKGRNGQLSDGRKLKTYSGIPPNFAPRNQSREMLQFGVYTHSNRVEPWASITPIPPLIQHLIDRLTSCGVFPPHQQPDTCTINVYQRENWLPPHLDNPAFDHPFATVSLVSEQEVYFGRDMTHTVTMGDDEAAESLGRASLNPAHLRRAELLQERYAAISARLQRFEQHAGSADAREAKEGEPGTEDEVRNILSVREVALRRRYTSMKERLAVLEGRAAGQGVSILVPEGGAGPSFFGVEARVKMPVGSALRLDGPAAAEYKHAVPPPTSRRISITLRHLSTDGNGSRLREAMSKKQQNKENRRLRKVGIKEEKKRLEAEKKLARRTQKAAAEQQGSAKSLPLPAAILPQEGGGRGAASPADGGEAGSEGTSTPLLEREHVQRVYDAIAPQWHGTRHSAWPRVTAFIETLLPGSVIGDLGCGNGKNLPACNAIGVGLGSDVSLPLVEIAANQSRDGCEVAVADVVDLPYRTGAFDAALCIAVLHHISTPARRLRAISECMRVVRVGGEVLFYAWAYEQEGKAGEARSGHKFASQDVLVPFHLRLQSKAAADDEGVATQAGEGGHEVLDEEKRAVVFQRYCHVYREGELEAFFMQLQSWVTIVEVYWDTGNWAIRARKIA
ncbi:hypothetical protein CYMTET_42545 [Cymbomonas tetramitiformis]|uniref:Fe2OG dioxygenase domain-containing protein n=1 Tax=Cymbomonas tetramitiformis TaxID=36881 RepID=A0AAE0F0V5_9CHLO|nr:hypothetical protein CYMTET_42545 [Cymbomonas tetramitiformis]